MNRYSVKREACLLRQSRESKSRTGQEAQEKTQNLNKRKDLKEKGR